MEAERFFSLEYRMDHLLFVYPKPIVAFIDGIVMGGGVGLSLPPRPLPRGDGAHDLRHAETGIGLFPDVGGGWAGKQLAILATKSPQTIKVALRGLIRSYGRAYRKHRPAPQ